MHVSEKTKFIFPGGVLLTSDMNLGNVTPRMPSTHSRLEERFLLSKDLKNPISIKLCSLESLKGSRKVLTPPSKRFRDPLLCATLSTVYSNSDLFFEVAVFDSRHNRKSIPVQSAYKPFFNTMREWNQVISIPMNYHHLTIGDYLTISLYEIVGTKQTLFGIAYCSLFHERLCALRLGSQKVDVFTVPPDTESISKAASKCNSELTQLEENKLMLESGTLAHSDWLDSFPKPPLVSTFDDHESDYFLYFELPRFNVPIVYSDIIRSVHESVPQPISGQISTSVIVKSVEIPASGIPGKEFVKISDPNLAAFAKSAPHTVLDPIEYKYHKLERNINNSLLDKESKPSPQLRDDILKILAKPSNLELNDFEKNIIWKFRYYLSRNNVGHSESKSRATTSFLPKFLKSISWDNEAELSHVFEEIIPQYWSVEKLQIGDALELLGSYFNPYTLTSSIVAPSTSSSIINSNTKLAEARFYLIFKHVTSLRRYAVDRLRLASSDELLLYLLQLVQALKYESRIYSRKVAVPEAYRSELEDVSLQQTPPLAEFLIQRSVESPHLGNFFYWYVKVEHEDQLNIGPGGTPVKIYSLILDKYIERLKSYSQLNKLPHYKHLKCQIWFVKKLTGLVELIRTTFKRNEATSKKKDFLKHYLATSSNELLKFPEPFPLPLDPSVMVCGCYPQESLVFKSSLAPLKITLKTITDPASPSHHGSQIFTKKNRKYGLYPLMFKIGDDLRQDQLVIQIINLMDQLLKNENLDLRLTPYKILATSPVAGLIQFVPNDTLDAVLSETYPPSVNAPVNGRPASGILSKLRIHSQTMHVVEPMTASVLNLSSRYFSETSPHSEATTLTAQQQHTVSTDLGVSSVVMDNYVKSCAGYCVITYILGVGDRHLDNLLLSPDGKFWHADFGYILGRDPKPFPPLMKLPIQVIDGMGGLTHENYNVFKNYCFITYTTLRKSSNLILNLFHLMVDANIPDIQIDPSRAVEKVQEKLCLNMSEEEAITHFQVLINDSVSALLPVVIDRLHSLAQYWRA